MNRVPPASVLRVLGDWSHVTFADGALFGGLERSTSGPLLYIGEGDATVRTLGQRGPVWTTWLPNIIGHLAVSRGGKRLLTAVDFDDADERLRTISVVDPVSGKLDDLLHGCREHRVAFDGDTPLVIAGCKNEVAIHERTATGWRMRAAMPYVGWPESAAVVAGRVHVFDREPLDESDPNRRVVRHWSTDAAGHTTQHVLPPLRLEQAAACGSQLYATFTRESDDRLILGRWNQKTWSLEDVGGHPAVTFSVLGFDETCRPFIGQDSVVWWRGAKRWDETPLGVDNPHTAIVGLAAHGGRLYVAYTAGNTLGVATSALAPD